MSLLLLCLAGLSLLCEAKKTSASEFLFCNLSLVAEEGLSSDACSFHRYFNDASFDALPLLLLAVIIFLAWPSTYISRHMLNCCGGSKPSPNQLCCVKRYDLASANSYTEKHIRRSKLASCPIVLVSLAGLIFTIVAGGKAHEAENFYWDGRKALPDTLVEKSRAFSECMTQPRSAPLTGNVTYNASVFASAEHSFEEEREEQSAGGEYERLHVFVKVAVTLNLVPLVLTLITVALAYCDGGKQTMIFMSVIYVMAIVSTVLTWAAWVGLVYIHDAKVDFEDKSPAHSVYFQFWTHECTTTYDGVGAELQDVQGLVSTAGMQLAAGCAAVQKACEANSTFLCSVEEWGCEDRSDLLDFMQRITNTSIVQTMSGDSLYACVSECDVGSQELAVAVEAVTALADADQVDTCVADWGVHTCTGYIADEFAPFMKQMIDHAQEGCNIFLAGGLFQVLAALLTIPLLAHGSKTFVDIKQTSTFAVSLVDNDQENWKMEQSGYSQSIQQDSEENEAEVSIANQEMPIVMVE